MKTTSLKTRRTDGVLLIECLVYIAVLAVLISIGMAAFYVCWDHTRALVGATEDINAALRAGERWRADVRSATGAITVEPTAAGERVQIPLPQNIVVYRFETGEVRREITATRKSELLLPRVKTSHTTAETLAGVNAWRWELDLQLRHHETQLPLLFTFEAVQTK